MNVDKILARELAKLGAIGGGIGGAIDGGASASAGVLGGGAGAYFGAKYLETETHSQKLAVSSDAKSVLGVALNVLSTLGKIVPNDEMEVASPCVAAIVGSGILKMNPCMTVVEVTSSSTSETILTISGAAKEGLVKQKTAEKAVSKIVKGLAASLSISPRGT
jgi:hypothetical protein